MKVMYIAPRFHTNQLEIIKGWKSRGDEVVFISCYAAPIEDYSVIKPIILGYSFFYYPIDYLYVNVFHRKDPAATAFKINHGFPPIFKLCRHIKHEKPDLVIMRDRTLYTMVSHLICNRYKIQTILYNQSPLWDNPPKQDLLHKLVRKLTPSKRMTPVMGKPEGNKAIGEDSYFVPFAVEGKIGPDKKQYVKCGKIELLSVGKFEPRKHHMMMIEIMKELKDNYPNIHLTIIGEATGRLQKEHHREVLEYIGEERVEDMVTVVINVPRNKTDEYYAQTDVFIIPSTREMASISQLEAMCFSVPVICSDLNGSSCYVENNVSGYLFRDCDKEDLKSKIEKLISDKEAIRRMGAEAYERVCKNYTFRNYHEALLAMIHSP